MSLRTSVRTLRRVFVLLVVAALALVPVGAGVVPGVAPSVVRGDSPVYPQLGSGHFGTYEAFANAGLVDLVNPVGAPNPTAASVTAVAGDGPIEGASLLSSDLSASQLGSTTLASLHLETLPLDIPLSTIPISRASAPKTWTDLLATTVLAGIPLQNVTWSQVNQLSGSGRPAALDAITLSEVDFSGSVLRDLPLAALTFGGANVSTITIPLQPGEDAGDTSNLSRWCYLINQAQAGACASAASLTGESLIDIGVKGAPLKNIPLKNIPLKNIDLNASPLKNIPLKNIALEVAPLKNIPLKNIDVAGSPLKNIPLKNILLDGAGNPTASPLKNIPLKNIDWAASPLKNIPLKNINLATSPLKNIPLKNIDFGVAPLKNIPLKNIDLSASGLGALPLGSIAWATAGLGTANLSQFDLASAPFAAIVLASTANPAGIAGCVTALPTPDCDAGETLADAFASNDILPGATLAAIGAAGFTGPGTLSDLLSARISGSTVDPTLGDLRLDLAGAGAPSVLLSALESALQGSPLPNILLGDLSLNTAAGVDTLVLDAITGNLLDPTTLDTYVLGDVGTYTDVTGHDITLGELGVYTDTTGADITLGELAQYLDDSVSLADVLLGLVPATEFPYEDFPIASLGLSAAGRPIFDPPNNLGSPGGGPSTVPGFVIGSPSTFGFGVTNLGSLVPSVPAELDLVFPAGSSIENVSGDPNPAVSPDPDGRVRLRVPLPAYPADFLDGGASVTWDEGLHLGQGVVTEQIMTADGQPIPGSGPEDIDLNPIQDGAEPNAPSEDPGYNSGRASLPTFPVNPSGCSGSTSPDCTGKDPTYIDAMIPGFISFKGDVDWYSLPNVRAGSRITADITNLPLDADLVLYGPAGLSTSPSLFPAANAGLPGQLVEDPGLGVGQAADSIAAQALGDLQLDQGYTSPLGPTPFHVPALTPISISAHRGTDSEDVGAIAPVTGDYVVAVTGYNGATSNDPYLLRARVTTPTTEASCPARTFPFAPTAPTYAPPIPPNANALFLIDPSRLQATYGGTTAHDVETELDLLVAYLNGHPGLGIVPAVVALDANPAAASAYAAWDANPCSISAANDVAEQITGIIQGIRTANPGLAYVTIVGGDDQVPMGRVPDLTRVSNESEYASTFGATLNPLSAAEAASYTLTDDVYGDPNPTSIGNGGQIFVPQMAVGRLVESPTDIEAALDSFTNGTNGTLDTSTALVAGYDFLSDGASAVASRLTITGRTVDGHLIDLPGTATPWTRDQLLASLFPAGTASPLIDSINAHYDHTALLPSAGNAGATGQVVSDSDFATLGAGDLAGRILFTMGCHAGLAVPDAYLAGTPAAASEDLDWAQELAQQNVAVYVANTGYGIGDTGSVAYSERLMALYAKLLDGSLTAGQALVYAKQAYYGSLGAVGVYDLKILQEAAFYGLPFWRIGTGNPPPPPPVAPPAPSPITTDLSTGLQSAAVSFSPDLELQHTTRGDYWTADGQDPQVTQYRPILPRTSDSVVAPGMTAHGAVITSLTSHDVSGVNPVIDMPTIDLSASSPEVATPDIAWPGRLATITSSVAPYGPAQALVVVPGQFVGSTTDGTGVQRLYDTIGTTVLYTPTTNTDFDPPQIASSTGHGGGSSITFSVNATDAEAAGGAVKRVLVGYHDFDGSWKFVDLALGGSGWTGTGSLSRAFGPADQVEYFVQAVDAAGNVAVSTNKGSGLDAVTDTTPPTITAAISPTPNGAGWSNGASATVTFTCTDAGSGISAGACPAPETVTAQGLSLISGTVSDRVGNSASVSASVQLDSVAPTISASINPPPNAAGWISAASATVTFTCSDGGSGLDGPCPAPVTVTAEGTTSVPGTVSDVAGNTATATAVVKLDRTLPTISAVVTPTPNSAGWNSGASATVSFICADAGSGIPSGACPASVTGTAEGVSQVSRSVTDAAGNTATANATVRLDRTKPVVTGTIAPAPNANGWNKGASATVSFTCTDGGAGLAVGACPAPVTVTAEGTTVVTRTAADQAGNVGTGTATVKLDRTPPVVTVSGFPLLPICSTTDALSGVANRATISFTFAIVAGVPTATAICSGGTDKAGNAAAAVSKTYATPLVFIGFLSPVANPPIVNVGTAGKTYKLPFQLWTLWAARVTTLAAVSSESFASVSCSSFSSKTSSLGSGSTAASGLVYDTASNQYVYSWRTPTTKGCYVLSVKLADGSTHKADFNLK